MQEMSKWLEASGPWGIIVCLGFGFWTLLKRKDDQLADLNKQFAEMSNKNTMALQRVEGAIDRLTGMIGELRGPWRPHDAE